MTRLALCLPTLLTAACSDGSGSTVGGVLLILAGSAGILLVLWSIRRADQGSVEAISMSVCPVCKKQSHPERRGDTITCPHCERRSIRHLWAPLRTGRVVASEGRVRHYRDEHADPHRSAPYQGILHTLDSDDKVLRKGLREILTGLPEGSRVRIVVEVDHVPEPGECDEDFWCLVEPHTYDHISRLHAYNDDGG